MKKLLSMVILTMLTTACGGSSNNAPTVEPPANPSPAEEQFTSLRQTAQQELSLHQHSPAVSIAIYHQGEVVFADAFGSKTLNGNTAATKDTLFQLGSVTKMFTALATMQLIERNMLSLDSTLVDSLSGINYPGWQAASWEAITVEQLLTHQSGLHDDYDDPTLALSLLPAMRDQHGQNSLLMNPPGKFFNYSNPNFSYLGAIIEQVSQQDYSSWMQANVFGALGMASTTDKRDSVTNYGDFALGVVVDEGQVTAATELTDIGEYPAVKPSGSYTWSTATDLLMMGKFLMEGDPEVLDAGLVTQMTSGQVRIDKYSHYGFGIEVADGFTLDGQWYEQPIWYHGGFTGAYRAAFVMLPERRIAIAILNSGPDEFERTMVEAIRAVAELPNPQPIPPRDFSSQDFDNHIGTYVDYANELTFEVDWVNDQLSLNIPELELLGQSYSKTLEYLGDGTFTAQTAGDTFYFSFVAEEEGGDSIYMRSREAVGIRLGFEPWATP